MAGVLRTARGDHSLRPPLETAHTCMREREGERGKEGGRERKSEGGREREREGEREREREGGREREREGGRERERVSRERVDHLK